MPSAVPRIAFFPDSFVEVNGAAMTCRRFVEFAKERDIPMLCVFGSKEEKVWDDGSVRMVSLKRTFLSIPLDEGLAFDPAFALMMRKVKREVADFGPSVMHITGLNDVSIIGSYLAWKNKLPLVGSWHTNLHEFASRRLERALRFLPKSFTSGISGFVERRILDGSMLYYRMPRIVLSPNTELVELLGDRTGRESRLMSRGVDCVFFDPAKRSLNDGLFRIGFVGRLRPEKNPRVLVDVEKTLIDAGFEDYEFLVVGEGVEREWLEKNLQRAKFTGFLEGEPLAEAYANMDVFVFPSDTDAYGNVAQEAIAAGVPAIVSNKGGPKAIIENEISGFISDKPEDYGRHVVELMKDSERLSSMKKAARERGLTRGWDPVFEGVLDAYRFAMEGRRSKDRAKATD